MALNYGVKSKKSNSILYTIVTVIILCTILLSVVSSFYFNAEDEAYEMLHIQTKQIKDDLILQIKSDRENLITMANFASKLYKDGEGFSILFKSFKPIGLFSEVRVLTPDNKLITKDGIIDVNGKLSFENELNREYFITGRVKDPTVKDKEIIRSYAPIVVDNKTVGILHGLIDLNTIKNRYNTMANELNAQLFVYSKDTGKYVIDTANEKPGALSELQNRVYNDGYSYEQLITTDKGFTSFKSIRTGENLYVHYSTIEDLNWGIILARYESQVFAKTHIVSQMLTFSFLLILLVISIYVLYIMNIEKRKSKITEYSSKIRRMLLEVNQRNENVLEALRKVQEFAKSKSAFLIDTDGEDYNYVMPSVKHEPVSEEERKYFVSELLRYAVNFGSIHQSTINNMRIVPNKHLLKTNSQLFDFMNKHRISDVCFSTTTAANNHVTLLGVTSSKKHKIIKEILEDIAICFSIALYNKKHLNKTEIAATTDSLTGAFNRVSYKRDIMKIDEEKPDNFSCIYIDVNELHMRNNKYGHAAGDEMLIYIANSLKEVFYEHKIYRMGGDEFLVFAGNTAQENIKNNLEIFIELLNKAEYKVAIGTSFRTHCTNCEEMVREAEIRMYEAKAQYYQNKENGSVTKTEDKEYIYTKTGIKEIDAMISIMQEKYNGIYRVVLNTDVAHRILMPSYLGYNEKEENFSQLLTNYINETVHSDFHRSILNFLNYDALRSQLLKGIIPKITYNKVSGESVTLSVHSLDDNKKAINETLWVFAKN